MLIPPSSDPVLPGGPGTGRVGCVGGGPPPHPFGHAHLVVSVNPYQQKDMRTTLLVLLNEEIQ